MCECGEALGCLDLRHSRLLDVRVYYSLELLGLMTGFYVILSMLFEVILVATVC